MVRYSIVVPVYNALSLLEQVLGPLEHLGPSWEVIAVDDGSDDGSAQWIAERLPWVRLVSQANAGQAHARNLGVSIALGETLFFVDSDVAVEPETLQRMAHWMDEHPQYDGVFGCYSSWGYLDEKPLSRFRNLLHRMVHREHTGPVPSFWTGLGALRKRAFTLAGGFDPRLTGIEDVGLGKRLTDLGGKILLNSDFEGRHLKRWTWRSMIQTDIFVRARPWTYYSFVGLTPKSKLNLTPRNALPPLLLVLAIALLPWLPQFSKGLLAAYLMLNAPRYRYFAHCAGVAFGLRSIGYLLVHHCCCLIGAGIGTSQAMMDHLAHPSQSPQRGSSFDNGQVPSQSVTGGSCQPTLLEAGEKEAVPQRP